MYFFIIATPPHCYLNTHPPPRLHLYTQSLVRHSARPIPPPYLLSGSSRPLDLPPPCTVLPMASHTTCSTQNTAKSQKQCIKISFLVRRKHLRGHNCLPSYASYLLTSRDPNAASQEASKKTYRPLPVHHFPRPPLPRPTRPPQPPPLPHTPSPAHYYWISCTDRVTHDTNTPRRMRNQSYQQSDEHQ